MSRASRSGETKNTPVAAVGGGGVTGRRGVTAEWVGVLLWGDEDVLELGSECPECP